MLGEIGGELAQVVHDRGQAEAEEEREGEENDGDKNDDCDSAGGTIAADGDFGDAVDGGHQDDGEEGADVEDLELLAEFPGEGEQEEDADGEEDVAAGVGAGLFGAFGVEGWVGLGKA